MIRELFLETIYRSLPPREAGLLAGMVWGDRSGFSIELTEQLKNSGLWHLVVVSGANVMILARVLVESLAPVLGRKKAILTAMVVAWGYVGVVGWEMPAVRALLLVSIYYWAQMIGRKFDVWRSIALTAIIVFVADPETVGSLSWWLSVAAFVGVITNNQKTISKQVPSSNFQVPTIFNIFRETVWVGVWVTPLLAVTLGKVSVISPLTNVAVVFLVEIITVVGLVGSLTGGWLLWLVVPFLKWFLTVVDLSFRVGGAVFVNFNWFLVAGWYSILFWLLLRPKQNRI